MKKIYRIVFENWSVEKAIAELNKPEYGHYKLFYSNIPELLRKVDWQKIKAKVNMPQYICICKTVKTPLYYPEFKSRCSTFKRER